MVGIAIDVANLAVAQMHSDAASTCTHVARRRLDFRFGGAGRRRVMDRLTRNELEHRPILAVRQTRLVHNFS